uniref:Uncharacterized protein n=1 Tax=Oryza meridionalis TaxID=40149 RepID=A0A0E0ESS5_9ORYZ
MADEEVSAFGGGGGGGGGGSSDEGGGGAIVTEEDDDEVLRLLSRLALYLCVAAMEAGAALPLVGFHLYL